jgi:uncharacterized delta-60 repeat protein
MERVTTTRLGLTAVVAAALAIGVAGHVPDAVAGTGSGDLDTTYGTNGFEDLGSSNRSLVHGIVAQSQTSPTDRSDLRVYLASRGSSSPYTLVVGRLDANGDVDTSFGTNGEITLSSNSEGGAIAVDGSDRIYVVSAFASGDVVRLTADGALDTGYGSSGYADVSGMLGGEDIAVTSGGVAVIGGSATSRGKVIWAATKFDANGDVDTSFGKRGKYTKSFSTTSTGIDAVAIDSQGRILLGGEGALNEDIVIRLTGSGSLDTNFGVAAAASSSTTSSSKKGGGKGGGGGGGGDGGSDGGIVTLDFGQSTLAVHDIVVDSGDDFYVSGSANLGTASSPDDEPFVAHYDASGLLDTGFGQGTGSQDGLAFPGLSRSAGGYGLVIDGDHLVQAGGVRESDGTGNDIAVFRYDLVDGSADTTFGPNSDGVSEIADDGKSELGLDLRIDANGDILVVGRSLVSGAGSVTMLVVRYCW